MSDLPTPLNEPTGFSIASLARHLRMSRDTVAARLKMCQVKSCGLRGGYPIYPLREAAEALLERGAFDENGKPDPDSLPPLQRRAWYQSENERLRFEEDSGNLILATEVQCEMAMIAKIVVRELETLPDRVERDLRCAPETIEYLHKQVRSVRSQIAAILSREEGEDDQ